MGRSEQKQPIVESGNKPALLPFFSTLRLSYILLAILFASALSGTYYYTSSYKFNMRASQNNSTLLELVSAFVSTYSEQRSTFKESHLPAPGVFKALSLKLFDKQKPGNHTMSIKMVGVPVHGFLRQLRWETGVLGIGAFLFSWGSLAFFIRQQTHITNVEARVLQENQRSQMLAEAREQAEKETSKLTEQVRKAYEDLRLALKKEREMNVLQRQFISMASHEFRTPLAIIDGAAQRLERRCEVSDSNEIAKRALKIRGAVERMTRLMESTLMAASLDVEKLTINVEPCDIASIISDACLHQDDLSSKHEISCNFSELPGTIMADPQAVEQIVSNLLSNAIKYAPDAPHIEVKAQSGDGFVVLEVRDHGLGIDEDDLPRIFERFFRARTATGISGTGIGLNLIKILIELHDGSISIASEAGKGSTFTVRLPINGPEEVIRKGRRAA